MSKLWLRHISVPLGDCSVDSQYAARPVSDPLRIGIIHLQSETESWCLISVDTTELNTRDMLDIRKQAADILQMDYHQLWIACTHTHAAWYGYSCLNVNKFSESILSAVKIVKESVLEEINRIAIAAVNTANHFAVNRRGYLSDVGSFSAYQCCHCEDNGAMINAADWARQELKNYGASECELEKITNLPLDGPVDGWAQLLVFCFDKKPVTGIVRFNAHPVIVSSSFYKPHFSRDYCGVLCDRLAETWACPFVFLQGPAGNQRTRHRENSNTECMNYGKRLADVLQPKKVSVCYYPLEGMKINSEVLPCTIHDYYRLSKDEINHRISEIENRLALLKPEKDYLKKFKELSEEKNVLLSIEPNITDAGFLTREEINIGYRNTEVAAVRFGPVVLVLSNHELANFFSLDIYKEYSPENCIVVAYVNGCDGYLLSPEDFEKGGYERISSVLKPENSLKILESAKKLILY